MSENKQFAIFDNVVKAKEDEGRVLTFVGSTESRDRMGDEIKVSGWDVKNYKKNPVFLWAHNYDEMPIGRAKKVRRDKEKNALVFDIEFAPAEANPKAEQVYQLYKQGFMSATSVGFQSMKSEWIEEEEDEKSNKDDDRQPGRRFKKQELLELSAVPVPANPEALIQARSKGMIELPRELEKLYVDYKYKQEKKARDTSNDTKGTEFIHTEELSEEVKTDNDILTPEIKQAVIEFVQKEFARLNATRQEDDEQLEQREMAHTDTEQDEATSGDEGSEPPRQNADTPSERAEPTVSKVKYLKIRKN